MHLRTAATWMACIAAMGLGSAVLAPVQFAIPLTVIAMLGGLYHLQRQGARRVAEAAARVEAVKGVRSAPGRLGLWDDPGRHLDTLTRRLTGDLEDSYLRLVKTNIQLLALKDVGRSIVASLDRERTVTSVLDYLSRGIGFREYALFVWDAERRRFEGGVQRRHGDRFEWVALSFAAPETSGVLAKCLALQRSYLIQDAGTHGVGGVRNETLFPESVPGSFTIVPLLRSSATDKGARHPEGEPACDPKLEAWLDAFAPAPEGSLLVDESGRCWDCNGSPVLGCIVATDTGREQPLSRVDLVMLETLGQNLSTVLENAQLYEDLRHEERFRENVIEGMSNGLISVDLDNRVTLFNHAAQRLSGHPETRILGMKAGDLISASGTHKDPLAAALETGTSQRSVEAVLHAAGGHDLPIRLTTSPLRDDRGRIYGVVGEFADLSTIKRMEAQIRHLDKLAALGRFTSSIAHEIRNPLAGITAGIQYLTRGMQGEEAEHVQFILAEVDRLNRIINDLFGAARPLELSPQETDVTGLVERSVRTCTTRSEQRGVTLRCHLDADLPAVALDADRIEQVMINLIQNAIDASPAGGVVEVEARYASPEGDGGEDALLLSVRDQGEGIPEEDRDKIFEPFFTTKSGGTGLGLYVCHHIVEGHGGQIVVESESGKGSCFRLSLPLGRSRRGGPSEAADLARR